MQVAITGRLQNRTWDDEQGNKHYVTEIIAEEFDFIENSVPQNTDTNILNNSTQVLLKNDEDVISNGNDLPF